jgi:aminoglycoside 6-adenylyltransferase
VRKQLFKMAEWHARSKKGWVDDRTWYRAKLIDQWADPRVVEALPRVYPHYDAEDVWRALFAMMELYGWLVAETGELLGYDTSAEVGERVSAWVHGCYGEEAG